MLMTEWNWDDALAVRYEEGHEDGWEEGREDEKLEIARNALAKGSSPEFVHEITGLDMDTIEGLRAGP
jgi:predicted transposase YdaD